MRVLLSRPAGLACVLAVASLLVSLAPLAAAAPAMLKPEPGSPPGVVRYVLNITVGRSAPDCGKVRPVLLVSGQFQPTIEVAQGDRLELLLVNNIPKEWPELDEYDGLSLHWHGFVLTGRPWFDGTAWIAQCPIDRGSSYLYNFTVDEPPGTYFWHDHTSMARGDGVQGALIVRPRGSPTGPGAKLEKKENILFLSDWWHYTYGSMAARLNRPFDPAKVTNTSGAWCWIGLPRSLLINGKGVVDDCENVYARKVNQTMPNGNPANASDLFTPNACVAGQLGPKAAFPTCKIAKDSKCKREEFEIEPGSSNLFRIINAGTLVYMTVCFAGQNVTIVSQDARPVTPPVTFTECVDVNSAQRLDVELKPIDEKAKGPFWITVASQYRKGAPSAFGVLRYKGGPRNLPTDKVLQPEETVGRRWDIPTMMSLKSKPTDASNTVPKDVDRRFVVHITQPLMPNGILRWALDNLVHAETPGCQAIASALRDNPKLFSSPSLAVTPNTSDADYFPENTLVGNGSTVRVLELGSSDGGSLVKAGTPKAGKQLLTLKEGEVIELVLQNNRAGAFGGEYNSSSPLTSNRNGREQHPFHKHGGHFWIVGMGLGAWSPDNVTSYNLEDPPRRDTATLMFQDAGEDAGWTAIRFVADNPGVWPLHCHIAAHQMMGQSLTLVNAPEKTTAPPKLPACPKTCAYQMAEFSNANTKALFGTNNPYVDAPLQDNGTRRLFRRLLSMLHLA